MRESSSRSGTGKRAMIVTRSTLPRQDRLERELARRGFDVTSLSDPDSARTFFQENLPGLVVLDAALEEGILQALCAGIRGNPAGRYVAILLAGGHDYSRLLHEAIAAGADHCLVLEDGAHAPEDGAAAADGRVRDLLDLKRSREEIDAWRREVDFINGQLEEAMTKTGQLAVEAELAYLELDQIFKTAAGGILVVDTRGNILRYNEGFLAAARLSREEAEGKRCREAFGTALCGTSDCPLQQIIRGSRKVERQVEKRFESGDVIHFTITSTPLRSPDSDLIAVVTTISDISARVRAEEALKESRRRYRELSIIDELTGLSNRRHFNESLRAEVSRTRRYGHALSLLLMDIDDFKQYNDAFGHTKGDQVLAAVGRIIHGSIRRSDSGFRYGGEEFVVILPETTGEAAVTIAERIRKEFSEEVFHPTPSERIHKTVSIGVAQYVAPEEDRDLVARADRNMYRAKQEGKNRVSGPA
ncbi:MAG: diguanylate cyclase [Deltaproteobacteria bacterium]|nr:diguanylate cyclase [Deltaproteobacteria bacterium]